MDKSVLIGIAALGGLLLLTSKSSATQQDGGYYSGSASPSSDSGGSSVPFLNFLLPDASPNFPKSSDTTTRDTTSKKEQALIAGSAAAASADINQRLNEAYGIGDATRAEGGTLLFNIPRTTPLANAVESYTAANYPNAVASTVTGGITFIDTSKKAAATGNGLYSPAPAGTGLYTPAPAPKKEPIASMKK